MENNIQPIKFLNPESIKNYKYKPLTEEIIKKVIDEMSVQNKKDLEEQTIYFYLNGWCKCSSKIYRKMFGNGNK